MRKREGRHGYATRGDFYLRARSIDLFAFGLPGRIDDVVTVLYRFENHALGYVRQIPTLRLGCFDDELECPAGTFTDRSEPGPASVLLLTWNHRADIKERILLRGYRTDFRLGKCAATFSFECPIDLNHCLFPLNAKSPLRHFSYVESTPIEPICQKTTPGPRVRTGSHRVG